MKIVLAVFANFESGFLGHTARLGEPLAGVAVFDRTLRRAAQIRDVDARCLFVRPRDRAAAEDALRRTALADRFDVLDEDAGQRPRAGLIRAARKWGLGSWRGTPLGTTWFDEFVEPRCAAQVLNRYEAGAVLCLDGNMPVLDPAIATAMLARQRELEVEAKFVFTQAPPGLAGVVLTRDIVAELVRVDIPLGLYLAYRPEMAQNDLITREPCLSLPPLIAQTQARFVADTRRSFDLLDAALRELGDDADAPQLCEWIARPGHDAAGPLPLEVEIELTTDDERTETTVRPRGRLVPPRRWSEMPRIEALARELAAYDDRLVVLGGHGDPLLHAEFPAACAALRSAGILGIAVVTPLLRLDPPALEALFEQRVDIVEIQIDAASAETYRRVNGIDGYERVLANVARLETERRARVSPAPLLVPSITRSAATIADIETFYDEWIRRAGTAVIRGYSRWGGLLPADGLLPTQPPRRVPCRRLSSRLAILADGNFSACGEDVLGSLCVGAVSETDLGRAFAGPILNRLRSDHAAGQIPVGSICETCAEWHRP